MVDRYYRKIEDVENDIENAMQISSILLKLKGYDDDLGKIDTNENNISSNLTKINNNETSISSNLGKINDIKSILPKSEIFKKTYSIKNQSFRFTRNIIYFKLLETEIENNFNKDGKLEFDNYIYYRYDNLQKDHHRLQHEYHIYDDKNNLLHKKILNKTNISDLDFDKNIMLVKDNFYVTFNNNYNKIIIVLYLFRVYRHGTGNFNLELINENFVNITYLDKNDISLKIDTNKNNISSNLSKIGDNTSGISTNSGQINTNTSNISDNSELINTNTSNISDNSGLISTNTSGIASNLKKINDNKDDITALQTSNVKAFYNLDQIFIYDIEHGYQTVDKNNHYHIFEKEITYNFTKNSYLEIILKVLSEVSNYILIGYFQILCNLYDQDDNLFYTISLSTAMGSINKLSTIKSVFIVPINENMSKIKIDFFIAPKETQQNRSAKFTIQDNNSNKIYVKYFQKTDEMSIKDIQDSLNTVNNIASKIDELEKIDENKDNIASNLKKINEVEDKIKLKNIKNILFYDEKELINFKRLFFDKTFEFNIKKNDFIEIDLKMLLDYQTISESDIVVTEFRLYDDSSLLYTLSYNNGGNISFQNYVFLNKHIFYNFEKDTKNLRIVVEFKMVKVEVIKIWYLPKSGDRLIIKHYGN